mgnify:CR=1 FL=1
MYMYEGSAVMVKSLGPPFVDPSKLLLQQIRVEYRETSRCSKIEQLSNYSLCSHKHAPGR